MTTIFEISAIDINTNKAIESINCFASSKEKAEQYLTKQGFEKITDTKTKSEEYQTFIKKIESAFPFAGNQIIYAFVKPYDKFID